MIAITREVSTSVSRCELTHLARTPIDYERARDQHRRYRDLLSGLGCAVIEIPGDDEHPDAVFIEDTAVVLDDIAVITRPGAESRRGETDAVAGVLSRYRRLVRIEPPATLDGGDVLVLDDQIYVGLSARTNEASLDQLRKLTGRQVIPVRIHGCLHLKSAVTQVAADTLLVHSAWIDSSPFREWSMIEIDPAEPFAANALRIGAVVVHPEEFPLTGAKLRSHGIDVRPVPAGELAKAEGGVTCCSLLVSERR